jgi:hypothetical protein
MKVYLLCNRLVDFNVVKTITEVLLTSVKHFFLNRSRNLCTSRTLPITASSVSSLLVESLVGRVGVGTILLNNKVWRTILVLLV